MKRLMFLFWGVFLCCLVFVGCESKQTAGDRLIYNFSECEEVALSDLFSCSNICRVEIQDLDSVLLSGPAVFKITDRYMVACHSFGVQKGVWLYSLDGVYLGAVGRVGRGPGEYIFPMDILMNASSDTLYIEDKGQRAMLAYSLPDRKLCGSTPFLLNSKCVALDKSGDFVWYVSSSNRNDVSYQNLVKTDKSGRVVAQSSPIKQLDDYSGMWQTITLFHEAPEGLMAHHQFQPELFFMPGIEGGVITLEFDNHEFAPESFAWQSNGFRDEIAASPYVQYYDVFQTSAELYVRFCAGKKIYIGVYDKKQRRGRYCDITQIRDDLGVGAIPRLKGVSNDRFYCVMTSDNQSNLARPSVVWFE